MELHSEPGSDAVLDEHGVTVARIGNHDLRRRVILILNALDGIPTAGFEGVMRGEMVARIHFTRAKGRKVRP